MSVREPRHRADSEPDLHAAGAEPTVEDEPEHLAPLPEAAAAYDRLQGLPGVEFDLIVPGWAPLTVALWEAASELTASPRLHVKEKLSTGRVTLYSDDRDITDEVRATLSALARSTEQQLERTCLHCGRPGQAYKQQGLYQIACPGCWDLLLAWRERTRIPEEQITLAQLDELTQAALADAEYRHERVSIELNSAVARRLVTDPETVLSVVEANLVAKAANTSGSANDGLDEWANLLGGGHIAEIVRAMLAPDFHGYQLRKGAPFSGVLSQEERLAAIEAAAQP